ncbi:electron transfer flavoprotein subunit beta [Vibrio olivae]|uniref:Electron transfer flavoprotein subunit beta n=1 Tax=Vibrio olivae TaxID=1243002 RepID=A0ABV5HHH2_9VIBR
MPHSRFPDLDVRVLVSIGLHPSSQRARRAETDARAVELGLNLQPGILEVLHAGNPYDATLRSYAGMGLESLRVIEQREQDDALESLLHYLAADVPDVILTGVRAERGESSGMMPYLLAEHLGCTVVSGITEILSIEKGVAEVLQAQPRGQRRKLKVPLPFIASVDMAAKEPRQSAFGPGQRAQIDHSMTEASITDAQQAEWQVSPARNRPKRLKVVKAKSAADRLKAATQKSSGDEGKVLRDLPAKEMAQAVFDLLLEEGVVR